MTIRNSVLTVLACAALSGCSLTPSIDCPVDLKPQLQETLYFGTGTPNGFVSKAQWASFVQTSVTPRFPNGFTVVDASGQWLGKGGVIVKEPSYILTLIHNNTKQDAINIGQIINNYKAQFQQESVLRVQHNACVSF